MVFRLDFYEAELADSRLCGALILAAAFGRACVDLLDKHGHIRRPRRYAGGDIQGRQTSLLPAVGIGLDQVSESIQLISRTNQSGCSLS